MSHARPLEMERLSTAVAKERSIEWLGAIALLALIGAQLAGVLNSPPDRDMGHLQKIMYVHVPSAWNAFIAFFVVAIASLLYLWKGKEQYDLVAASAAEVGTLFTGLTLVLGSIWGRPTWGGHPRPQIRSHPRPFGTQYRRIRPMRPMRSSAKASAAAAVVMWRSRAIWKISRSVR